MTIVRITVYFIISITSKNSKNAGFRINHLTYKLISSRVQPQDILLTGKNHLENDNKKKAHNFHYKMSINRFD